MEVGPTVIIQPTEKYQIFDGTEGLPCLITEATVLQDDLLAMVVGIMDDTDITLRLGHEVLVQKLLLLIDNVLVDMDQPVERPIVEVSALDQHDGDAVTVHHEPMQQQHIFF